VDNDPLYQLLSIESETPRPRLLHSGSLDDCLDAYRATILEDVAEGNRGVLVITATWRNDVELPNGGYRDRTVEVMRSRTTGDSAETISVDP
jgi:hypothetical protein